ncbi:unnamed protein product [Microthlaspi erraticum]|uniref:Uncharacterized protein n=1 Tax=Microthlaspi erraticum TaxID=1685480 RepID=A0A6D2IFR3_9BRAS|nr:unnamed protein product [Microthlaspi erraticum]
MSTKLDLNLIVCSVQSGPRVRYPFTTSDLCTCRIRDRKREDLIPRSIPPLCTHQPRPAEVRRRQDRSSRQIRLQLGRTVPHCTSYQAGSLSARRQPRQHVRMPMELNGPAQVP